MATDAAAALTAAAGAPWTAGIVKNISPASQ